MLKPDRKMLDHMLSVLDRQKESPDWIKEEGRYVPGIKKWLEDRYRERVPADSAVEPRSRDEPGADPIWEYVTIEGQRYARKKMA